MELWWYKSFIHLHAYIYLVVQSRVPPQIRFSFRRVFKHGRQHVLYVHYCIQTTLYHRQYLPRKCYNFAPFSSHLFAIRVTTAICIIRIIFFHKCHHSSSQKPTTTGNFHLWCDLDKFLSQLSKY